MSEKPAVIALEDELAAYFARSGFTAVEIEDLPDISAIPWQSIDLEELDPAHAAKGSGQIPVARPDDIDERVRAIAIPRLSTAEIEALVGPVVASDRRAAITIPPLSTAELEARKPASSVDPIEPELEFDLVDGPATADVVPAAEFEVRPERTTTIPPRVPPHATVDIKVAARAVVAQRLSRVELRPAKLPADEVEIAWLAPVAISVCSSPSELAVSVIIFDAQLEAPV